MSGQDALARAQRYLQTAALALASGDAESCVSRAYYAIFYIVRALLAEKHVHPKTHSGTFTQFSLHFVKAGIIASDVAAIYDNALELRAFAEYAETFVIDPTDAQVALDDARRFVEQVAPLLP